VPNPSYLPLFESPYEEVRMHMRTKLWSDGLKGGDLSEEPGVDGKITLEWILGK